MRLLNARTGQTLADRIELATTRRERRRGLLGRRRLPPGFALVLRPCAAIHTAFMRCAIDVIFVDGQWRTVRIARHLRPWRLRVALRARSVIELPAGALSGVDLACGDRVALVFDK